MRRSSQSSRRPTRRTEENNQRSRSTEWSNLPPPRWSSFIPPLTGRYDRAQGRFRARVMELRRRVHSSPLMLAFQPLFRNCQAELKIWLQFAGEIGALSKAEEKELQRRICVALKQVGLHQSQYHQAADPALQFVTLLQWALASGGAHVADRHGRAPDQPEQWGWRHKSTSRAWLSQDT